MAKHIFLIHGRDFKPDQQSLTDIWMNAIRSGINRDFGDDDTKIFDDIQKTFIYYGDLSNKFLAKKNIKYNMAIDKNDREISLNKLKSYGYNQFVHSIYHDLYKRSGLYKFIANIISAPLYYVGLGSWLISSIAPDMREYWNRNSSWGSDVRDRLTQPLIKALEAGDEVLIISHSMGTMIAYDVLWKLSYYGEYKHLREKKIDLITMGSPLGDINIKNNLKGAKLSGSRRYPININEWINIAAVDDYVSHADRLDNNFGNIISDKLMYNLSLRFNKSNPHNSAGYLISPVTVNHIGNWIQE